MRFPAAFLLLALSSSPAFADMIVLPNGSSINPIEVQSVGVAAPDRMPGFVVLVKTLRWGTIPGGEFDSLSSAERWAEHLRQKCPAIQGSEEGS
jgi:hypothetical protein